MLDERQLAWDRLQWRDHAQERSPAFATKDLADYISSNYYPGRTIGWVYVIDPKLSIPAELRVRDKNGAAPSFAFQTNFETAESAWNTAWPITPENIIWRFSCFSDRVFNTIVHRMNEIDRDHEKYLYAWAK